MEQKIRRDRNMGDNLRALRSGCDIGRTTYAKYEAGELNIRVSVLIELKKIYGCSYDDFSQGWISVRRTSE